MNYRYKDGEYKMDGIIIVNKPKGITSRDVVNEISKKFRTKKVGHTGTLDPIATGVMVVCLNAATKLVDKLTSYDKEYIATCILGIETDTLDNTGKILNTMQTHITKNQIETTLNKFIGSYEQEVPKYSAIKINGKKLYEYARENIEVKLPKRNVIINNINLVSGPRYMDNKTEFTFKCSVSKGTYIRSLIRDIASDLNTYGIMTDLIRTKQGNFDIKDAISLDQITENTLIRIKDVLTCQHVQITDDIRKKVLNGANIMNDYNSEEVLFMDNNQAVALYIKDDKNKNQLKVEKMLKGGMSL